MSSLPFNLNPQLSSQNLLPNIGVAPWVVHTTFFPNSFGSQQNTTGLSAWTWLTSNFPKAQDNVAKKEDVTAANPFRSNSRNFFQTNALILIFHFSVIFGSAHVTVCSVITGNLVTSSHYPLCHFLHNNLDASLAGRYSFVTKHTDIQFWVFSVFITHTTILSIPLTYR